MSSVTIVLIVVVIAVVFFLMKTKGKNVIPTNLSAVNITGVEKEPEPEKFILSKQEGRAIDKACKRECRGKGGLFNMRKKRLCRSSCFKRKSAAGNFLT